MLVVNPDITVRSSSGSGIYQNATGTNRVAYEKVCRIILIHGFQNSEQAALDSYGYFKYYFDQFASLYSEKVFTFIWPGDHIGPNLRRYFDYNVQNSLDAGGVLGRYLVEQALQTPSCQFIIVAHSLGCRLTAAMVKEVYRNDPTLCKRFKIVFMAAAVPSSEIADPNIFGTCLNKAEYAANLFSNSDKVLGWIFRLGEWGGGRTKSDPIGLHGGLASFKWSEHEEMKGYGHSDYWRKSRPAEFIARLVGANTESVIPMNDPDVNVLPDNELD